MTATVDRIDALTGQMIIAGRFVTGTGDIVRGLDPSTDTALEPGYAHGSDDDVEAACAAAAAAFDAYRSTSSEVRAAFLEFLAE